MRTGDVCWLKVRDKGLDAVVLLQAARIEQVRESVGGRFFDVWTLHDRKHVTVVPGELLPFDAVALTTAKRDA